MSAEWLKQAERDLDVARHVASQGFHEWACYAAQQAAEKAVKAVRLALGTPIETIKKHEIGDVLGAVAQRHPRPHSVLRRAHLLDAHNQASRYPGLRGQGPAAPCDTYQATDSTDAIATADAIVGFCRPLVTQIDTFWSGL
ncbi:MAG TPA: HEPN domain-containing protein [Kofleriaceae bacterium]|jgi:HEPN domain-containing protein